MGAFESLEKLPTPALEQLVNEYEQRLRQYRAQISRLQDYANDTQRHMFTVERILRARVEAAVEAQKAERPSE